MRIKFILLMLAIFLWPFSADAASCPPGKKCPAARPAPVAHSAPKVNHTKPAVSRTTPKVRNTTSTTRAKTPGHKITGPTKPPVATAHTKSPGPGKTVPGKTAVSPGKTAVGPGKTGPGPGKTAVGPGKTAVGPGKIGPGPGKTAIGPGKVGPGPGKTAVGPGKVGPGKTVAVINKTTINKKTVNISRDRRRIWVGGIWRSLVPVVALSGLYVGSRYYYPDGYVALARPYCQGLSEEGCTLNWQEVPVEGGGVEVQCVQFCPRAEVVGSPPPPPPQALVTPLPASPQQAASCEIEIFSEPNFAGMSTPASENVASLEEAGWKNEIASIQVISGVWEFYAADDFAGEAMRLRPGAHGNLGEWTKRIGSLMCIEPTTKDRVSSN